ncbi:hypothetical protein Ahy_B08g093949 [Arachis hypogaea]|uniref:Uncharacterized protein n=1 Tax=Arachis hypogaea TaxID=3818 RepID=A0A444Y7G1_ARAHY|nr:hypothetical protein Ahy_B08g093949 [Arachis hypogaea]
MATGDNFLVLNETDREVILSNSDFCCWGGVKYDSFVIGSDEGLEVLFHYHRQFLEVRIPELLTKLVDVVSNSG